jgi:hypothetical protein
MNLPTSNCRDNVVNWLLSRKNFVNLNLYSVSVEAINPFSKSGHEGPEE